MAKKNNLGANKTRIDFSNPPAGKAYCPMPISEEMIIEWKLDRRYIVKEHKFSSTKKLCYMVLVDEDLAKAYVQDEKSDCKRMERLHRCIIPSPITGQPICCPDTNSCYGCKYAGNLKAENVEPLSYEKKVEDEGYEIEVPDHTSDEGLTNIMTAELLTELRSINEKLAMILELRLEGLEVKEIGEKLNIKKSTLYDDMKKIVTIATKYLND